MRTRILCLPRTDDARGVSGISQLAFYLHRVDVERVTVVPATPATEASAIPAAAMYASPDQDAEQYDRFAERIRVADPSDANADTPTADVDIVISWDSDESEVGSKTDPQGILNVRLRGDDSLDDHRTMLELVALLRGGTSRAVAASMLKMQSLRNQLDPGTVAYVLLNAPGDVAIDHPAVLIADAGLRDLNLVAADGSLGLFYVSAPERHLPTPRGLPDPLDFRSLLDDERTYLIVPDWAHDEFVRVWPDHADQVIALPPTTSLAAGSGLHSPLASPAIGATETAMLLPLAEYMSKEIRVIAAEEPVGTDADWAETLLTIEKSGGVVSVLGPVKQRDLARRRTPIATTRQFEAEDPAHLLVSVNPDWVDEMGHHAHFDRAMRTAALTTGGDLVSLASKALVPDEDWQVPAFTHPTYGFDTAEAGVFIQTFGRELESAIRELLDQFAGIPIRVMMYSAAIAHLISMVDIAAQLDDRRVSFFVNLLRAHNDLLDLENKPSPTSTGLLLQTALDVGPTVGVHIMADTREIGEMLKEMFGQEPPVWPMVGVTPLDAPAALGPPSTPPVVCYPATQEIKGLQTFTELAEALAGADGTAAMKLVARDTGHQPEWTRRLTAAGVELIPGVLTPDAYARFMEAADIVVLPYRTRPFRIQTSGVFADAVQLRKPAVATRSTWAGRLIDEHGIGATFSEGDVEAFKQSVLDVAGNYAEHQKRMVEFAPRWLENNNPAALLRAFEQIEAGASDRRPDLDGAAALRSLRQVVEGEARRCALDRAESAEQAVLTVSGLNTTIERLEQRVSTRDRAVGRLEDKLAETRADRDKKLANLGDKLANLGDRIAKYETRLETRDRKLAQLQKSVDHHKARLESVLADYDTTTRNLRTRIETREETIGHLKQAITQRDEKLATSRDISERRIGVLREGIEKRDTTIAALSRRFSVRLGKAVRRLTGRGN